MVFGIITLVTGPLWARKAWGVWWVWDARLTSSLVLWMIFVAYLLLRRYGGPGSDKLGAGMALFGMANVPFIYVSVNVWRTLHPQTSVVPTLPVEMGIPLWFCVFGVPAAVHGPAAACGRGSSTSGRGSKLSISPRTKRDAILPSVAVLLPCCCPRPWPYAAQPAAVPGRVRADGGSIPPREQIPAITLVARRLWLRVGGAARLRLVARPPAAEGRIGTRRPRIARAR